MNIIIIGATSGIGKAINQMRVLENDDNRNLLK